MSDKPQPGDQTPSDAPRPGDRQKALGHEPDDRAGDKAPTEHASRADHASREGPQTPIGGVHFSAPFIRRPVATFLLSFAIILAGAVAYTLLPVSGLPQIEFPVISVERRCRAPIRRRWPRPSRRRSSGSLAASPASTR